MTVSAVDVDTQRGPDRYVDPYERSEPTRDAVKILAPYVMCPNNPNDPTAMILDGDNRKAGWADTPGDVPDGQAFTVKVRRGLFAVDWDRDESDAPTGTFSRLVRAFRREGIPTAVVASGRPGNRHLWADVDRIPDTLGEELADVVTRLLGDGKAVRVGQRMRPPLSPHRHGRPVGLVTPRTVNEACEVLVDDRVGDARADAVRRVVDRLRGLVPASDDGEAGRVGRADQPVDGQPYRHEAAGRSGTPFRPSRRPLTERTRRLLETEPGGDRSRLLSRVVAGMVNAGRTDDEIVDRVMEAPAGAKARERGPGWLRTYVVGPARKWVADNPPTYDRESGLAEVDRHVEASDSVAWDSAMTRKVLAGYQRLCREQGGGKFRASQRDVQSACGVGSRTTVNRHTGRILEEGWMRCVEQGHGAKASKWRLTFPFRNSGPLPSYTPLEGSGSHVRMILSGHDAGRWNSLGAAAQTLVHLDEQEPRSVAKLALMADRHPSTIYRRLSKLSEHGLAHKSESGEWLRTPDWKDLLSRVAFREGTFGAGDVQRWTHDRDREQYLLRAVGWAVDNAPGVGVARIARRVGVSEQVAEEALADAAAEGSIHRDGHGRWWKGRAYVDPETGEKLTGTAALDPPSNAVPAPRPSRPERDAEPRPERFPPLGDWADEIARQYEQESADRLGRAS